MPATAVPETLKWTVTALAVGWLLSRVKRPVPPASGSVVAARAKVGETSTMVALTLAGVAQQKFGGDSAGEMQRNFQGYIEQIRNY